MWFVLRRVVCRRGLSDAVPDERTVTQARRTVRRSSPRLRALWTYDDYVSHARSLRQWRQLLSLRHHPQNSIAPAGQGDDVSRFLDEQGFSALFPADEDKRRESRRVGEERPEGPGYNHWTAEEDDALRSAYSGVQPTEEDERITVAEMCGSKRNHLACRDRIARLRGVKL